MTNKLWRALRCWQPVLACRVKSSLSSSSALEAVLDFLAAAAGGGTLSEEQNGGQNEQQGGAKTRLLSNKCKLTSLLGFFGSVLHIGAVCLLRFAVPAWTCADTDLKAPAAQDHAPADTEPRSKVAQWMTSWWRQYSLLSLQGQDGEDGPAVHAPHAGTIAHKTEEDGGEFRAELKWGGRGIQLWEGKMSKKKTTKKKQQRNSGPTWGGSYGTVTLCLFVCGSSKYWARWLPSILMRWLRCAAATGENTRKIPPARTNIPKVLPFLLPSSFWWWGHRRTTSATCSIFL